LSRITVVRDYVFRRQALEFVSTSQEGDQEHGTRLRIFQTLGNELHLLQKTSSSKQTVYITGKDNTDRSDFSCCHLLKRHSDKQEQITPFVVELDGEVRAGRRAGPRSAEHTNGEGGADGGVPIIWVDGLASDFGFATLA
jgi:hypothetical protein